MQMEFQATEQGKQLVASLEFALELKDYLAEGKLDGDSEELGSAKALTFIAWAMSGHDINQPPQSAEELLALANFLKSHRAVIKAAANACLETLVQHDCGPAVN